MRRLILAPLVTGPIAAATAVLWITGLAYPIATQVWSVLAPRPAGKYDEADVWA